MHLHLEYCLFVAPYYQEWPLVLFWANLHTKNTPSKSTLSHVRFVNGILLVSALQKVVLKALDVVPAL